MMNRLLLSIAGLSFASLLAMPQAAEAQGRYPRVHSAAPPLTITKRSWLDSGNVVAVGTADNYVAANTTLHNPVYNSYIPAKFGQSTLPGRFDLPFQDNPRGPETGGIFETGF